MSTTSLDLKQDGLGRVRTPAARREELLAEFARSGLCGARFATLAGVNYQTFMGWVHKQNRGSGKAVSAPRPPRFVEVMAPPAAEPAVPLCHRAHQNQPRAGTSKPASLRRGIHSGFVVLCKIGLVAG